MQATIGQREKKKYWKAVDHGMTQKKTSAVVILFEIILFE